MSPWPARWERILTPRTGVYDTTYVARIFSTPPTLLTRLSTSTIVQGTTNSSYGDYDVQGWVDVQRHHVERTFMMSIILPDSFSGTHLPQACCMVRRCLWRIRRTELDDSSGCLTSHKVCRIGTERTIPHPTLVSLQDLLELELIIGSDRPDLHCSVCRASGEISTLISVGKPRRTQEDSALDIRAEKTPRQILTVRLEFCDSLEPR